VFSIEERDSVRERLLELAEADSGIVGAAVTGSPAFGGGDQRSDIDLAFGVEGSLETAEFRPHGPNWRTVFGHPAPRVDRDPPSRRDLTGLAWHHALHARVCIHRRQWWQAEHWIGSLRNETLALVCVRLGMDRLGLSLPG
jgi:hypothetical protein